MDAFTDNIFLPDEAQSTVSGDDSHITKGRTFILSMYGLTHTCFPTKDSNIPSYLETEEDEKLYLQSSIISLELSSHHFL